MNGILSRLATLCVLLLQASALAAVCHASDATCPTVVEASHDHSCHQFEATLNCSDHYDAQALVPATPAPLVRIEPLFLNQWVGASACLLPPEPVPDDGGDRADHLRCAPALFTFFSALLI